MEFIIKFTLRGKIFTQQIFSFSNNPLKHIVAHIHTWESFLSFYYWKVKSYTGALAQRKIAMGLFFQIGRVMLSSYSQKKIIGKTIKQRN